MTDEADVLGGGGHSKKVARSPAYPYVTLEKAVARAKQISDKEGKHAAPFEAIAKHWDFSATSSGAKQTVAALRQFGLLEVTDGTGAERTLKLTELGRRIALEDREQERLDALRKAALQPKLYAFLWEKWGAEMPSDETAKSILKVELDYNPGVVGAVLQGYKDTLEYAKMAELPASASPQASALGDAPGKEDPVMTSNPAPPGQNLPPPGIPGEIEYFRSRLAEGRTVRVLFDGPPPTQNEIDKLIKLLEMTKDQYPEPQ